MAWEALNNIAIAKDSRLVIVVNDNGRSYQPTIGGLATHLAAVRVTQRYEHVLDYIKTTVTRTPIVGSPLYGALHGAKKGLKDFLQPQVPARSKAAAKSGVPKRAWSDIFADEMVAIGTRRPDVVAITAAMLHPVGLAPFAAAFPDRVYDVGIAEQHALTSAAGLALGGLHPVVALYSTFLNRAFDQLLIDLG